MAEVILMGRRTEHQLVCSTYRSRTKPSAQTKATIRATNVITFSNPSIVRYFSLQIDTLQNFKLYTCIQKKGLLI